MLVRREVPLLLLDIWKACPQLDFISRDKRDPVFSDFSEADDDRSDYDSRSLKPIVMKK